ncbi:trigger factor [Adlercreutzia sp. R25]|uniref:Trigger factor n=1 Tax=Adlercreutzia shanghongiae TaxID=3111773 RepID=A0ABU6IX86_9ACTN|nr:MULTISPECIES: trigger factor [unclassified Adlercreutzia]MEC4272665.1 trigger factor [Adlercreutzia sp. R25]MEC4294434.1 trigger factor [Adlercreutzia sp. R22]
MEFIELSAEDPNDKGAIVAHLTASAATVRETLADFYETVAASKGLDPLAPWDEIHEAAQQNMGAEAFGELRRDYVVNRLASEGLSELGIKPALTPKIHVVDYPQPDEPFAVELSVVERPSLTLSSYEPVVIEDYTERVTDELVDERVAQMLETRATYEAAEPRPVRLGDSIAVDIMTLGNGKAVPHLTGSKMYLDLVPGEMPDGFVNEVVGMNVGETKVIDYQVKRPQAITDDDVDRYSATVTVIEQLNKHVPALSDEWVDANVERAATVAEFLEGVRGGLEAEVELVNRDACARLANIELEKRLVGTIPDEFYQASRAGLMDKLERDLKEKGQTLDDYLEAERMNEEELSVQMLIQSGENLRQGFALEALFNGRGMKLTEAELKYACEQAFGPGSYDEEALQRTGRMALVESSAKRMAALNWLADTAIIKGE